MNDYQGGRQTGIKLHRFSISLPLYPTNITHLQLPTKSSLIYRYLLTKKKNEKKQQRKISISNQTLLLSSNRNKIKMCAPISAAVSTLSKIHPLVLLDPLTASLQPLKGDKVSEGDEMKNR